MAIQVRRGYLKDFDPTKMLPGEWAVSIDSSTENQIVWMCFAPGVCKRIGTYEDFQNMIDEINGEIISEYQDAFQGKYQPMLTKWQLCTRILMTRYIRRLNSI